MDLAMAPIEGSDANPGDRVKTEGVERDSGLGAARLQHVYLHRILIGERASETPIPIMNEPNL